MTAMQVPAAPNGTPVRRVLVHRQGSLGDTVVALPSLHAIRRAFPTAELRLLTNLPASPLAAPAIALLQPGGLVQGSLEYPVQTRSPRAILDLMRRIRAWRPDVAVYLVEARPKQAHLRDMALMRLAGVRRLVGYDPGGGLSEYRLEGPEGLRESEARRLLRAVAPLGPADIDDPAAWDLRLTPEERAGAARALGPLADGRRLVAMSIGTKAQANDYEDGNWRRVLAALARRAPEAAVVALGAPGEAQRTRALLASWPGRSLDLCGRLSVRESAAVLERAAAFMGHDSGPMHLAAAMGTPCVAVFSARNLRGIWFPHGAGHAVFYRSTDCSPCGLFTCEREGKRCILSIPPEAVAAACADAIARPRTPPRRRIAPEPDEEPSMTAAAAPDPAFPDGPVRRLVAGVPVSVTDYDGAARAIMARAEARRPYLVTALAVHGVMEAARDAEMGRAVRGFDIVTPDGQPVRMALNLFHRAGLADRVYGPTLMLRLCAEAAERGVGVYLYGSTPETVARLADALRRRLPGLAVVGAEPSVFRELSAQEGEALGARIRASGAGLVFVGLGCPRQERFAHRHRDVVGVPLICVGAAFDFHAGTKRQAPAWMQRHALEWLFRLGQEPRRLAGRYLRTNTAFVLRLVAQYALSGRKGRA